jgi:cephalosporin hydroxylase
MFLKTCYSLSLRVVTKLLPKFFIDGFHTLYYYNNPSILLNTFWLGVPVMKCPLDLWEYQEIIYDLKPDIIIECGTAAGGGALFLASMCDLVNHGNVITIDIESKRDKPMHKRIKYLLGSSTSGEIIEEIRKLIRDKHKVVVILDSDHHKEHVLNEMQIYSEFVTQESYLIVEDTNINGHPVGGNFGPGPMEAVNQFLTEHNNFLIDQRREKFYLTFNSHGYIIKKSGNRDGEEITKSYGKT